MRDERMFGVEETARESGLSRRSFVKMVAGGIVLFFTVGELPSLLAQRQQRNLPSDFNAFLHIGEDGRVTCFTGKIEMGQGVVTSLAQMIADEMDVELANIDMIMGDTDLCPWDMGTFGSMTTRVFGPALRLAAAEARMVLVELASEKLNIPINKLSTENGTVFNTEDRSARISYAQLASGKKIIRHATGTVKVKEPSEFRIMATPVTRRDGEEKVTGSAKYSGDIRLPDMLYASILCPPFHGAKLLSVDVAGAKKYPGAQVIRQEDFIAVLHPHPDIAAKALVEITPKFDAPTSPLDSENIFDHLLKVAPEGKVIASEGDLTAGEKESKEIIEQTYFDGYKAHAPMETHTALVDAGGEKVTVWASTQNPFTAKEEVAKELGISPEHVRLMPVFVGGGFGGKTHNTQIIEAARLSKISGKPVQVCWNREEEFFYDAFRPAAIVKIRSGVSGSGKMHFWNYRVYYAGDRGAAQFYTIPNQSTVVYSSGWGGAEGSHPFTTGPWRAPGNNTNTFARESQIDEMAARIGADPLAFRMDNLSDKRMRRVLLAAAEKFGWKPAPAPSGRGWGIACGIDAGTYVAAMAEVAVEKSSGNISVKRVVCAQDMGLSVNPEGAALQMEGCITMGLGYALREDLRFRGGKIFDHNFDTYEIPRFSWLPKIETVIIDDKHADPHGGGEPAIILMGAAVGNALFDAAGIRMVRLPMIPERVKKALDAKKG